MSIGPKRYEVSYVKTRALTPITRSGGLPNRWNGFKEWPVCGECAKPMSFLLQVVSNPIDLRGNAALQVFGCVAGDACPAACAPFSKANHVFLIADKLDSAIVKPPARTPILKSYRMTLKQSTDPSLKQEREKGRFKSGFCDKFDGREFLRESSEKVRCRTCGKMLVFLGQFLQLDLSGIEDFFISLLKICPGGHSAAWEMVRG